MRPRFKFDPALTPHSPEQSLGFSNSPYRRLSPCRLNQDNHEYFPTFPFSNFSLHFHSRRLQLGARAGRVRLIVRPIALLTSVEVLQAGGGKVAAVHAYESSNRLYVSGSAGTSPLSVGGHMDIQLVDANGQVVAERRDTIRSSRPRPGGGKLSSDSFVVSFPLAEARQAVKVRVIYHGGSHS